MRELILLRGLPGSGKSSLAETIYNLRGDSDIVAMVAADDFRMVNGKYVFESISSKEAHRKCQDQTDLFMRRGTEVIIVHNTFTTDWEMDAYFALADTYGYLVRTVIVENRHGSQNVHDVPSDHIKRMEDRFTVHLTPNAGIHTNLQDSVLTCLDKLRNAPQRPDYHPEIWVYDHIAYVTGQLLETRNRELIWAGLFHDLGKLETSKVNPKTGHITSYDHDNVSARYVEKFKDRIPSDVDYDAVHWLVLNHMRAKYTDRMSESKRNQLTDSPYWPLMEHFTQADDMTTLFKTPDLNTRLSTLKFHFETWVKKNVDF